MISSLSRGDRVTILLALLGTGASAALTYAGAGAIIAFIVSAVALAILAMLVGRATEELGARLGPKATGTLQAALGNLPELFVGIFSLRAGLVEVVQATLIGSILANSLLILGLSMLVGGWRHGTQRFDSAPARMAMTLMLLSVAALMVPTLAVQLHVPAAANVGAMSVVTALVLLLVFGASIPVALAGEPALAVPSTEAGEHPSAWPLKLAIVVLALAAFGAALVSEWFVRALEPAMAALKLSPAFTGLIIVAIAGNAVEHAVAIQLAARNKPDYALSVVINSSLQIALGLIPVLVLISFFLGGAPLTLVLRPLLVAALALSTIATAFVVYDGESIWLEGVALIALYAIIAVPFWWG